MAVLSLIGSALSLSHGIQLSTDDIRLAFLCQDLHGFFEITCLIPWVMCVRGFDGRPLLSQRFVLWALSLIGLGFFICLNRQFYTDEPRVLYDFAGVAYWGRTPGPIAAFSILPAPVSIGPLLYVSHRWRSDDRVSKVLHLGSAYVAALIGVLLVLGATLAPGLSPVAELLFPLMALPAILFLLRRQMLQRETLEATVQERTSALDEANTSLLARNTELATTLEELQSATAAQAKMLANVSHELRTPLHAVIASTQLIVDGHAPGEQRELAGMAHQAGQDLSSLIDDLLDAARPESFQVDLVDAKVDVAATVEELLDEQAGLADSKGLTLVNDLSDRLAVRGDPRRVRQILRILIANAVRYSDSGEVRVAAEVGDGRVNLIVEDRGKGIPEADIDLIFEPFRQVDRAGELSEGTGLGLSIARDFAERMGGNLSATSTLGQGSRFVLSLREAELTAEDSHARARSPISSFRGRVMVVDDNALNRLLALRLLQSWGLDVELAESGAEAIAKAPKCFDLILMDCYMPEIDGFEASRQIRALGGTAGRTPIVALTASSLASEEEQKQAVVMDGHLTKPIDIRRMQEVLRLYCDEVQGSVRGAPGGEGPAYPSTTTNLSR